MENHTLSISVNLKEHVSHAKNCAKLIQSPQTKTLQMELDAGLEPTPREYKTRILPIKPIQHNSINTFFLFIK